MLYQTVVACYEIYLGSTRFQYTRTSSDAFVASSGLFGKSDKVDFSHIDVEYIYGFVWWGGLQAKSMTSERNRQIQDGGYSLLW